MVTAFDIVFIRKHKVVEMRSSFPHFLKQIFSRFRRRIYEKRKGGRGKREGERETVKASFILFDSAHRPITRISLYLLAFI